MQEPLPRRQRAKAKGHGNITVQIVGEGNEVTIAGAAALRLARHLGTSARFWMTPQTRYDLAVAERPQRGRGRPRCLTLPASRSAEKSPDPVFSVSTFGKTPEAAIREIGDVTLTWMPDCHASGDPVPGPTTKARRAQ
jgi:hypothetical protein